MSREEMIIQEIQRYLGNFKIAHGQTGMTVTEKMDALERGMLRFFAEHPEE